MSTAVTIDTVTNEITWSSAHNCSTGDMTTFTADVMPSPLVYGNTYYAIVVSTTVMRAATTRANAIAGTGVTLTTTGTTVVGTKDLGRINEVNQSMQYGSQQLSLSNVPLATKFELKGLIVNSEVRAYLGTNPATAVEIGGIETSNTSFQFTHYQAGKLGFFVVFIEGYQSIRFDNFTYGINGDSLIIQQIIDRQYINPA